MAFEAQSKIGDQKLCNYISFSNFKDDVKYCSLNNSTCVERCGTSSNKIRRLCYLGSFSSSLFFNLFTVAFNIFLRLSSSDSLLRSELTVLPESPRTYVPNSDDDASD